MNISEAELYDPFWEDEVKELPEGVFLLIREIKKALNNESFLYFEKSGENAVSLPAVTKEERDYYFSIFHNCEEFGLPYGRGWLNELSWTIQLLTQLKYIKRLISLDRQKRAERKTSASAKTPSNFEGY